MNDQEYLAIGNRELLEKIFASVENLRKNGTLENLLEDTKPRTSATTTDRPFVSNRTGYKEIQRTCDLKLGVFINRLEDVLGEIKFWLTYPKSLYDGWVDYREDIKNPDILKYLDDYEAANGEEN